LFAIAFAAAVVDADYLIIDNSVFTEFNQLNIRVGSTSAQEEYC